MDSKQYEDKGRALLFRGDAVGALAVFEEGLCRFPGDLDFELGCGMALNDLKRPAEARVRFGRVIAANPRLTDALQGLAEAELALGNKKAAAKAARLACDRPGEDDADFVHCLGLLLFRHKLYSDAEHCYRRAAAIDRTHGHAWLGLASSLHQQGQRDEAISILKEAVADRLPGFWEGYSYLGCLLHDAGRDDEARRILGKIPLDELRDSAAARRLRAQLDAKKQPEKARFLEGIEKRASAGRKAITWVVEDDARWNEDSCGHGTLFFHAATGGAVIAFIDGFRGDDLKIHIRKNRPEPTPISTLPQGERLPTPPAGLTWERIVGEVRSAAERYVSGRHFEVAGCVWTVMHG